MSYMRDRNEFFRQPICEKKDERNLFAMVRAPKSQCFVRSELVAETFSSGGYSWANAGSPRDSRQGCDRIRIHVCHTEETSTLNHTFRQTRIAYCSVQTLDKERLGSLSVHRKFPREEFGRRTSCRDQYASNATEFSRIG